MTDENLKLPSPPQLTQEQIDAIAGAGCTVGDVIGILDELKQAYEKAIDLTVYVMERVGGNPSP